MLPKARVKLLIVNRALGTLFGGGESFDYNAAKHLVARGHRVTLLTGKPLWGPARNTFLNLKVIYVAVPNFKRFAYATERLNSKLSAVFYHLDNILFEWAALRWIESQPFGNFDVIQCCSLFGIAERLLEDRKQAVVSWLPGPPSGRVRSCLRRLVLKPHFSLFCHGSTEWTLLELGFVPKRDYEIIEPGIDFSTVDATISDRNARRKQLGIGMNDLVGVTTARLVPVKNHELLFSAIVAAKLRGVVWQWLLIGDGPLASKLKLSAQKLGIAEQVHFLGHQEQQEVHSWLAAADLFGLTSSYESFSIAALEAMAHRLLVIGTNVGYLKVLLTRAKAGRLVGSSDTKQLGSTLVEMADPQNRAGYGEAGRQFVEQLGWPNIAIKLENLYKKTISNSNVLHTR